VNNLPEVITQRCLAISQNLAVLITSLTSYRLRYHEADAGALYGEQLVRSLTQVAAMTYVNLSEGQTFRHHQVSSDSKRTSEKLLSLAMTNFVEPSVHRLYKVKAPLKSASSVLFCPSTHTSTSEDLQRSGGLMVADLAAGKVVQFDASDGRYLCDLISNVEPRNLCMCAPECLALIDSNEWGSCVKVVSVDTGHVLTTWGRQLHAWTPRAIATTHDGHLVVSNVHPQASNRLSLFTPDGKEVTTISIFVIKQQQ